MVDHKKDTGSSGEMIIRDNGNTVSFLINSHNSSTFTHDFPWGYTINGTTNNDREGDYGAGDGWVTLGSWSVTYDQTVTFRLFDTGTSGLGGPTTLSAFIDRTSVPDAPSKPVLSEIKATSIRVRWTDGSNNGAGIDIRQVARNVGNSLSGATYSNTDNDTVFTGLNQGTTYYFWARTHNAKGWSPYSPVASAKTTKVPDAPDQPIVSNATQNSVVISFTDNGNGGSAILERQVARNTSNTTTGATTASYTGVKTWTGLNPATTYYFWARSRNAAGWGPYSPVATLRTIAGARVNVNNVWKEAIPYVNVGGVWKVARPWVRDAGVWKETT